MGQAVYIRGGSPFKAFLSIKGNSGDTVTITGPELNQTITLGSSASTVLVNKKGTYTFVANVANISTTIDVQERNKTYSADLSFKFTVTVTANPGVTVTLSTTTGTLYTYSGKANDNGVAAILVYRKGTYSISSDATTSGTVLAEGSSTTIECANNNDSKSLYYVRVSDISAIYLANYNSSNVVLWWDQSNTEYFTAVIANYTSDSSYPTKNSGGSTFGDDAGTEYQINATTKKKGFLKSGLVNNITYKFSAWAYVKIGTAVFYGTGQYATWTKTAVSGSKSTSGSGTWVVPEGVRSINIFCCGGGGGGGAGFMKKQTSSSWYWISGGGGGGGCCASKIGVVVTPGETLTLSVGNGGAAASTTGTYGATGGETYVSRGSEKLCSAGGGSGGGGGTGGNGGSGGGCGSFRNDYVQYTVADGGSNGANGSASGRTMSDGTWQSFGTPGTGQGATVVTFNGTVYAGGGGGGGITNNGSSGNGGNRGGGRGGYISGAANAVAAANGTNGTGGGGGGAYSNSTNGGAGGSGAIVINY